LSNEKKIRNRPGTPAKRGYTPSLDFRATLRALPLLLVLFLGFAIGYTHVSSARGTVDRVMTDFAGEHRVSLEDAYGFYLRGNYTEAVKLASQVTYEDPENALAYNILGLSHAKRGFTEEASLSFNTAVTLDPEFALAWFNLGIVEESRGENELALEAFNHATELEPDNQRYEDAFDRAGRMVLGEEQWARVEDENVKLFMEGVAAVNSDKPEDYIYAENIFRSMLLTRPYDVATRNMLGYALARQGRLDEAESLFVQVIEIEPGFSEAWYNLGIVHRAQGRLDEALTDFETAYQTSSVESFQDAVSAEITRLRRSLEE